MKKYVVRPKYSQERDIRIGNHPNLRDSVLIGKLAETGQLVDVHFDTSSPHVVSIFGKRGSGKSYTLGSLLEGLCTKNGNNSISINSNQKCVLLFDTLGIFQWMDTPLTPDSNKEVIIEQLKVHKSWNIALEPLNVQIFVPKGTTAITEEQKEFTIGCTDFTASDWGYLFGVDLFQDKIGQLLNTVYEKVKSEGWTDGEKFVPPKVKYKIKDLIDCLQKDEQISHLYHAETIRALNQQFSIYLRNPLFEPRDGSIKKLRESVKSEIDVENETLDQGTQINDLLKPGYLSILLLHKLSDDLRLILIVAIIRKIMQARIELSEIEKHMKISTKLSDDEIFTIKNKISKGIPPTWIVADEAQNFLPSEKKTTATDVLLKLVREGRNFGLSFILTTQQPSAIDQRILAQVDTMIIHKLTVQGDIDYIKRNMKSPHPDEIKYNNQTLTIDELIRSLEIGQALVSNTEMHRSIIIDIRPRVSVHGGFDS